MPIRYVMAEGGLQISDLTAIAFYDKPYLKFERLLETYHAFAPCGSHQFSFGDAGLDQGKTLYEAHALAGV